MVCNKIDHHSSNKRKVVLYQCIVVWGIFIEFLKNETHKMMNPGKNSQLFGIICHMYNKKRLYVR